MIHNIFLIDELTKKIVGRFYSLDPTSRSIILAQEHGEVNPIVKDIPTVKYPTRKGILTNSDFFIHFFPNS